MLALAVVILMLWSKAEPVELPLADQLFPHLGDDTLAEPEMAQVAIDEVLRKAQLGDMSAQYVAGVMHFYGHGLQKDHRHAADFFRKAALQGHVQAQTNMGLLLANGKGLSQDDQAAVAWFRAAAEVGGDSDSQWMLAQMLYEKRGTDLTGRPRYEEAFKWFEKSAEQGHVRGLFGLGILHEYGLGVLKDYKKAASWYRQASDQGYHDATYYLALMHAFGRGQTIDQDIITAGLHFKRCAAADHPGCLYYMGQLCLQGQIYGKDGISVDYGLAQFYLLKAIRVGDAAISDQATTLLAQIQSLVSSTQLRAIGLQKRYKARSANTTVANPPHSYRTEET